jgi:hypothetical protein
MNPKLFGRSLWIIIFEYLYKHKDNIEKIKKFYWIISEIIPCHKCSHHFKSVIITNNVTSSNDWDYIKNFTIWLYNTTHKNKIIHE